MKLDADARLCQRRRMTSDPDEKKPAADIDDDLDEPLGTPASCSMEDGCESCQ